MTNIKKLIPIILLFIVVGLAIVTTTLGTEGTTPIASNPDDFNVYFSKALVNGVEDQNIIVDKKTLYFENTVNDLGETYIIEYDITNASKQYDAEISVTCTAGNNYISVTNTLDTSKILARETRNGTLVIKKIAVNEGETITHETTCTITANAVEKDTLTETDVPTNLEGTYSIGEEITIGTEKFNIIKIEYSTVTMLAQYNLGTDYRQSTTVNNQIFATSSGWEYTPGPKEIDIQIWSSNPKTYINEYVTFLQSETGDLSLSGDLITLKELSNLGCVYPSEYELTNLQETRTCENSIHIEWLANEQFWWTKSAESTNENEIWRVDSNGLLDTSNFAINDGWSRGIRPTITISKEILDNYL